MTDSLTSELIKALIGLVFTGIIGAIVKAYFDYKAKLSENIIEVRIKAYIEFVKVTKILPKYSFPKNKITWQQISVLPNEFKDWYFEGHGIVISSDFRDEFFKLQDFLIEKIIKNEKRFSEYLTENEYNEFRSKLSSLRSQIAKELKSREVPFWTKIPTDLRA